MKIKIKNIIQILFIIFIILSAIILFVGCKTDNAGETLTPGNKNNKNNEKNAENSWVYTDLENHPEVKVEAGYTAPDFTVELLNGDTVKLSDYRGKMVFLNFWATWCSPCVREMPDIQSLSETYPDDLIVLAVNCSEKKDRVKNFIDENGFTFNVGLDENGTIQDKYPTRGIPYTIIMDRDGIITSIHIGVITDMISVYEEDSKVVWD